MLQFLPGKKLWVFLFVLCSSFTVSYAQACGLFCHSYFWNSVTPELMEEWLPKTPGAIEAKSSSGHSAVHFAAIDGRNPKGLLTYLRAGARPNAEGPNGMTPLFYSVQKNDNPAITGALLEGGADPNARDKAGFTPLFHADKKELVKVLIDGGADANIENDAKVRPLLYAILAKRDASVMEALLEGGGNPEVVFADGRRVLHYAILEKSDAATVRALAKRAKHNVLDDQHMAPLHYAAEKGGASVEVARALLEEGADPNLPGGKSGVVTPTCLAESNNRKIVKWLKKFGGKC